VFSGQGTDVPLLIEVTLKGLALSTPGGAATTAPAAGFSIGFRCPEQHVKTQPWVIGVLLSLFVGLLFTVV